MKIKNIMIIALIGLFSAVNAKNLGTGKPAANVQQGQQQPQVIFTQHQPAGGAAPVTPTQTDINALFKELMAAPVPWSDALQAKYNKAKDLFSEQDHDLLVKTYNLKKENLNLARQQQENNALQRQFRMQQQQQGLMQLPSTTAAKSTQQPGVAETPWTWEGIASGAATRARALGTYGWEKLQRGYGKAQSTLSNLLGSYQSSIGTGTKLALSLGAIAIAPYLGVAAALGIGSAGLLGVGGVVGLGTYALTSALDKLEYRYKTGEWSDEKAEEVVKGALEEILRDSLTYPTIAAKIAALSDINELYGLKSSSSPIFTNIVKKAHESLKQQYTNLLATLDAQTKDEENRFVRDVNALRTSSSVTYDNTNYPALDNYAASLAAQHDLIKYEAVLSEYRRALKLKGILEEKARLAAQQRAAQTPAQASTGNK